MDHGSDTRSRDGGWSLDRRSGDRQRRATSIPRIVTVHYGDGSIAVIKNSRRASYGYDQRVEILGSEGLLSAGNVLENTVAKATSSGVVSAKPEFFFLERYMRAYEAEWSAFVAAVANKSPVPATLADGVNALAVAEAATRSAKARSTVELASVL